ncbi:MAG: chromosome segregation protein SMC [Deltaproteobacteria bacterium]|nr:chromosome segregation protein SMC [Deltaproteobacteria bacterium]
MKIKTLTIHGFKSFVDKTTFSFPSGASAIVGPNGCGKSNIVDAIRWVLGEQNARHLRGKEMQDVIFNGSDARKPLGMAEVVLTFANDNGSAPSRFADYTEIEVSRRLYRSGESEYCINKVQSRLRDVIDLFTDTGIGTRAYSIIEQGQVGWLINAKPEERRVIFEEAAGISKFKHKKEAALRRLEATRENLTRVNDIISEVKRQLNSLNRQAKKAERYKAVKEELKTAEVALSTHEFLKLKTRLREAAQSIASLVDEEAGLASLIGEAVLSAESLKAEAEAVDNEYRAMRENRFAVERRIQSDERISALSRMRIEELVRAEERLIAETADLERQRAQAVEDITLLNDRFAALADAIAKDSASLEEHAARLGNLDRAFREKEDAHKGVVARNMRLAASLQELRHSLETCLRDEEAMRAKEAKARAETAEYAKGIDANESGADVLRDRVRSLIDRGEEHALRQKGAQATLSSIEEALDGGKTALRATADEHALVNARLLTLEEMEKSFENLKGGAKSIMQRGLGNGVKGLLADCIEANPGYERAVEAVLGERLQCVMVEDLQRGVEAIEYLKSNAGGRGSFVSVNETRSSPLMAATMNTAGSGGQSYKELLSEVRIKEGYQELIGSLLGEACVVDGLGHALEIWRSGVPCPMFVTLNGETIDASGVITGGDAGNAAGLLEKRGEIKKAKETAAELSAKIAALEADVREMEANVIKTRGELSSCAALVHSLALERVNAEAQLASLTAETGRLVKLKTAALAGAIEAEARLGQLAGKKADYAAQRQTIEEEAVKEEAQAALLSATLLVLAKDKEAASAAVTEIKVGLAGTRERLESLKGQVAAKAAFVDDAGKRIISKQEEIERSKAEAFHKAEETEILKTRLEQLLSEADAFKKQETKKAESIAVTEARIKEIEAGLKALNAKQQEMQELKGDLSVEVKEIQLGIDNIRDRIAERYAVSIEHDGPAAEIAPTEEELKGLESQRQELREKIAAMGEVSLSALEEFNDLERRHQFLVDQQTDLSGSVDALMRAITRINGTTREKFRTAFDEINAKFQETFPKFFSGGRAELRLTEDADILEAGVEIAAQPPGKRLQNITLLSGGEKALTATSLVFAIFLIKPSPFCLLDEVDAPLDDANIDRFNSFVREMAAFSQFLLITHNKKTMEMSDALYGITMEEPGVSKTINVRF